MYLAIVAKFNMVAAIVLNFRVVAAIVLTFTILTVIMLTISMFILLTFSMVAAILLIHVLVLQEEAVSFYTKREAKLKEEYRKEKEKVHTKPLGMAFVTFQNEAMTAV